VALAVILLLGCAPCALAAEVEYQHPDLTIVAQDEPLHGVLQSLGREMRIFVTIPSGLNPRVHCNIQRQPIEQALKGLLGDVSYSLEWEAGSERLVGLTIFSSQPSTSQDASPARTARFPPGMLAEPSPGDASAGPESAHEASDGAAMVPAEVEANAMELAAQADAGGAGHETDTAAEREAYEAEVALRRQEAMIAQEERLREETARHEAQMRAYVESQGIQFPD